jgi:hypothetical protein
VGVFAQDRWRPVQRLMVEFGARLDWDGVLERANLTPRAGLAFTFGPRQAMMLRGGLGVFYERPPLNVRAFDQMEARIVTRYAADGRTPLGPPVTYSQVTAPGLRTPRSVTWNVGYDVQASPALSFGVGYLERQGHDESIVDVTETPGTAALTLSSNGHSRYREMEWRLVYTRGTKADVRASYVRSSSSADLNAYSALFGSERDPLVRPNEYGPTPGDVPNRLVVRAQGMPGTEWFLQAAAEWRTGFPFSAVDAGQAFVGPRNRAGRFPTVAVVDAAVERRIRLFKWRPWMGLRVSNLFNAFAPLDVQGNIDSAQFGHFYSTSPRQFSYIVRVSR